MTGRIGALCLLGLLITGLSGLPAWAAPPDTTVEIPHEGSVQSLALTPTRLYGVDVGGSTTVAASWVREESGVETDLGVIGPTVHASAGRALIGKTWLDDALPGGTTPLGFGERKRISGPYVLGDLQGVTKAVDVAGRSILPYVGATPKDHFGWAFLFDSYFSRGSGAMFSVDPDYRLENAWGPWVSGLGRWTGPRWVANWRTGSGVDTAERAEIAAPGAEFALGDGILVTTHDGVISVFDTTNLDGPLTPAFSFEGTPHSVERNRLAWTTPTGTIMVSTFPFGGQTGPLLLGEQGTTEGRSTDEPWSPEFDLSSPVESGSLLVRDRRGVLVHTIPTPESLDGSLRLEWDTRDSTGRPVPAGDYAWELVVSGASGATATGIDNYVTPTGHLTVSAANLPAPNEPRFIDPSGTASDRIIIPDDPSPLVSYAVNGEVRPAGTYAAAPGTAVVTAVFSTGADPVEWRHDFSADGPEDVYSVPGEHLVNGRRWRTTCEPYSVTTRCRTEIWATQVTQVGGVFRQSNGWVFNNLTYLPSPRSLWHNTNPLGYTNEWTAADGRMWRTECDTAATGQNGCRSYLRARVIVAVPRIGGGYSYQWDTRWVFNNMVRFS